MANSFAGCLLHVATLRPRNVHFLPGFGLFPNPDISDQFSVDFDFKNDSLRPRWGISDHSRILSR